MDLLALVTAAVSPVRDCLDRVPVVRPGSRWVPTAPHWEAVESEVHVSVQGWGSVETPIADVVAAAEAAGLVVVGTGWTDVGDEDCWKTSGWIRVAAA
jgi:hypothetical protein